MLDIEPALLTGDAENYFVDLDCLADIHDVVKGSEDRMPLYLFLQWAASRLDDADDTQSPAPVQFDQVDDSFGALAGADQEDVARVVPLQPDEAQEGSDQQLFGADQEKRQDDENSEKAPAEAFWIN